MSPAPASWIGPLHALRTYLSWLPAKNWLPGRSDFVEATDARGMRGCFHKIRIFFGLSRNRAQRINKQIALFFRLRFSRFNHHRAGNDQWERRSIGMKAVVDETFGNIHRVDAVLLLSRVAENHFVHGW